MPRIIFGCLILLAGLGAAVQETQAGGQGYPGGGRPGMGGQQGVGSPSGGEISKRAVGRQTRCRRNQGLQVGRQIAEQGA